MAGDSVHRHQLETVWELKPVTVWSILVGLEEFGTVRKNGIRQFRSPHPRAAVVV